MTNPGDPQDPDDRRGDREHHQPARAADAAHGHDHDSEHGHAHHSDHDHSPEHSPEHSYDHAHDHAHDHETDPAALRAEALESLLIEKGLLDPAEVDAILARYNDRVGPLNGARVVARAWRDAAYRDRLLADGTAAAAELDIHGGPGGQMEKLVVVENSDAVHNVVVCTLCSCYPWAMLGLPPRWYKDPAYRSRIVREPRAVLGEFGMRLPDEVEIRVWDSSAEVRYLVLPQRPAGSEALDEDALAELVPRDAMIGVAPALSPASGQDASA